MRQSKTVLNLNGTRRTWIGAFLGTVGLNLALFAMMPSLMAPTIVSRPFDTLIPQINLIRIKRREAPPKKKPEPMPEIQRRKPVPTPEMNHVIHSRLSLPFEINTRLPAGPNMLELPGITPGALDSLDLGNLFGTGDLDQPLTALTRLPPAYPLTARNRGIEGWVNIRFVVTEQGNVEDVAVIAAEPREIFNASVMQCVSAWRFKPGTVGGVPVKTRVETTIRFELD